MKEIKERIDKALGHKEVDLVLKNGKIINVFTNEIIEADLAIDKDLIIGFGDYVGREEIDLGGDYISPGFIDGHVHIESSMLTPSEFSKISFRNGVTSAVVDPHEIANISGIDGIKFMLEDGNNSPMDFFMMLPSCVPATEFESNGAILEMEELRCLMDHPNVIGLGELMNYPGLIKGNEKVLEKLKGFEGRVIDGHSPKLSGRDLTAYVIGGVSTEHEASTVEEAIERVRLGMYVLIREGSAAKDLKNLIKAVNKNNISRFLFCTDDKHPKDLLEDGSINYNINLSIACGIDPIDAIKMATINICNCYGLKKLGAIAPSYKADLVSFKDLNKIQVDRVYKAGKLVYNGDILYETEKVFDEKVLNRVNIKNVVKKDLEISLKSNSANIIGVKDNSIITDHLVEQVEVENGCFKYSNGLNKLVVVERHRASGNIGLGILKGFNIKDGAIGTTIAHDSHNIIVAGDNDEDILNVINHLKNQGGGVVISSKSEVLESLSLEISGNMSYESIHTINRKLDSIIKLSYDVLGVNREVDPLLTLGFLALPVIPSLKLTDRGLFNVEDFSFINIWN